MGRGRTLAGKFVYFCSAGLIFFLLAGFMGTVKKFV